MTVEVALGIDIGTSGVHAVATAIDGRVVAEASTSYPTRSPRAGWSEQSPQDWLAGLVSAVKKLMGKSATGRVAAIGLTGQMNGLVAVGSDGEVLRPAILWNDRRTEDLLDELQERMPGVEIVERTGNRVGPMSVLGKLCWLRHHEPELFANLATAFLPKDYLGFLLIGGAGRYAEVTDASATNLLDFGARRWDDDIAQAFGIPRAILPELVPSTAVVGRLDPHVARELGLPPGIPVVAGAGDNAASAVCTGLGPAATGRACLSLGTSGVMMAAVPSPIDAAAASLYTILHPRGGYLLLGSSAATGSALTWFRTTFAERLGFDGLDALARRSPPGAAGVAFRPASGFREFATREDAATGRGPSRVPEQTWRGRKLDAIGTWRGITPETSVADLARALVEGVATDLREVGQALATHLTVEEIYLTGRASRLNIFVELLDDQFDGRMYLASTPNCAAIGAAWLALESLGVDPASLELGIHWDERVATGR